jgi:hypothetical protein
VRYLGKYATVDELASLLASTPERLHRYESERVANRDRLRAIYQENDDAYLRYVREHVAASVAVRASQPPTQPSSRVCSADLVVCSGDRVGPLATVLDSMLTAARQATSAGIPTAITVVHQDAEIPDGVYAHRPDLRREKRLRFVATSSAAQARNAAVAATMGDLVIFVDDRCFVEPGFVEAHATAANAHPRAAGIVGRTVDGSGPEPHDDRRAVGQIRASGFIETHFASTEQRAPIVPIAAPEVNVAYRRATMNALCGKTWFDELRSDSVWLFRRGGFLVFAPNATLRREYAPPGNGDVARDYQFLNMLFARAPLLRAGIPLLQILRDIRRESGWGARLRRGVVSVRGFLGGRALFAAAYGSAGGDRGGLLLG